ncbi:hypothetical protein Ahy_A09g043388 [Arachis hypogaea]|uniref:Uncharacterized protein n=1 Tax=Arachis hypogaea TaxID=3818 RepID=A0A445BI42_ARAHY|nr:hypothetical protein Ahy_A09g043388 [Arachis hypogaea]
MLWKLGTKKNEKPEDYVHHKLTIEAYNRTYQFHINSIPSQEYWEHHEGLPCLPPPYKSPIGRPSKKRKKDNSEQKILGANTMPRENIAR